MELPAPPPPLTIEAVQQELVATSIGESGIRLSQEDASQDPELEPIEPERQYEREAEDNEKAAPLVTDDDADWVLINRSDRDRLWYRVPRGMLTSRHFTMLLCSRRGFDLLDFFDSGRLWRSTWVNVDLMRASLQRDSGSNYRLPFRRYYAHFCAAVSKGPIAARSGRSAHKAFCRV